MVDNILESKLQSTELSHARSSLDQFNSYLKDAAAFALPEQDDDVKHSKVSSSPRDCLFIKAPESHPTHRTLRSDMRGMSTRAVS